MPYACFFKDLDRCLDILNAGCKLPYLPAICYNPSRTLHPFNTSQIMHPAEFKTLREAIGLSISTLVKVIDVDERSIRKWESGKKKLPLDVIEQVVAIDQLITDTANNAFDELQTSPQDSVTLHRYIEEEDYLNAHPEFEGLPITSYGVVLYRLRQKLIDAGVPVSIVYV